MERDPSASSSVSRGSEQVDFQSCLSIIATGTIDRSNKIPSISSAVQDTVSEDIYQIPSGRKTAPVSKGKRTGRWILLE